MPPWHDAVGAVLSWGPEGWVAPSHLAAPVWLALTLKVIQALEAHHASGRLDAAQVGRGSREAGRGEGEGSQRLLPLPLEDDTRGLQLWGPVNLPAARAPLTRRGCISVTLWSQRENHPRDLAWWWGSPSLGKSPRDPFPRQGPGDAHSCLPRDQASLEIWPVPSARINTHS